MGWFKDDKDFWWKLQTVKVNFGHIILFYNVIFLLLLSFLLEVIFVRVQICLAFVRHFFL